MIPAPMLVFGSVLGIQVGQTYGKELSRLTGPMGVVTLRLGFAALILLALWRPRIPGDRRSLSLIIGFGTAIAGMSFFIYPALARLPVGMAVTLQFLGPLTVALAGSRRLLDLIWALLAGAGIFLFCNPGKAILPIGGVIFALSAGAAWAAYILLNKHLGARTTDGSILALAVAWAALLSLPIGIIEAGPILVQPKVLLAGLGVAILSAVVPYSLDVAALRRLPSRVYSVLESLEPAVAGCAGLLILGEHLTLPQWLGIGCVTIASIGIVTAESRSRRSGLRCRDDRKNLKRSEQQPSRATTGRSMRSQPFVGRRRADQSRTTSWVPTPKREHVRPRSGPTMHLQRDVRDTRLPMTANISRQRCGCPSGVSHTTVSRHITSEGLFVYTRCRCGTLYAWFHPFDTNADPLIVHTTTKSAGYEK